MSKFTTCLATAAIALGAVSFAAPALADDDIGSNPITEFFNGLGLSKKEKPDIDYQERAPLVPPTNVSTLPPPEEKGSVGKATGQWPNDPDVERRARRKADDERVTTERNEYRMNERGSRLDPDEIGARRVKGANVPTTAQRTEGDNDISRLDRKELQEQRLRSVPQNASADGAHRRLSDPPANYLEGTGTTAQVEPEKKPWYKRMFGN